MSGVLCPRRVYQHLQPRIPPSTINSPDPLLLRHKCNRSNKPPMASLIEVSGEANPLTRQNLFNALVSAAGTTQQQVQTGGQQLQNWEKQENYYPFLQVTTHILPTSSRFRLIILQDIFVDYSLPVEVRYLSIIQLKNGIDKYWRKTANKYDIPSSLRDN